MPCTLNRFNMKLNWPPTPYLPDMHRMKLTQKLISYLHQSCKWIQTSIHPTLFFSPLFVFILANVLLAKIRSHAHCPPISFHSFCWHTHTHISHWPHDVSITKFLPWHFADSRIRANGKIHKKKMASTLAHTTACVIGFASCQTMCIKR